MVLLWLPTTDAIFHIDWTLARSENRALAKFPQPPQGWQNVQPYVAGLEAYFNDHFGCRKCLVQWNNKLRWWAFDDKNSEVLVGKDGWMFTTGAQMIDHYSGLLQFTPDQLHDWQVLLEKRRDWLAQRGISYLFVVAPDKQTIYPEGLPDWVTKVSPQTKMDQFFTYMREHSTVPVLDLRNAVLAGKKSNPTFWKTDTHWNFFGSFLAYQEVVRALAKEVPAMKLEPMPFSDFNLSTQLQAGGDLARILGLSLSESNAYTLSPKPGLPLFTTKLAPPDRQIEPKFSYTPSAKGSLIVFQDSFGLSWMDFLAYNFHQVTYLWQYDLDPAWIEREKPDIVVNEMVERFFDTKDPKKLMAKEALN